MNDLHVSLLYGVLVYVGNTVGAAVDTDRGRFILKHIPDWAPPDGGYLNLGAVPDDVYNDVVDALDGAIVLTPTGEAALRIRRHTPNRSPSL